MPNPQKNFTNRKEKTFVGGEPANVLWGDGNGVISLDFLRERRGGSSLGRGEVSLCRHG